MKYVLGFLTILSLLFWVSVVAVVFSGCIPNVTINNSEVIEIDFKNV